MNLDEIPVETDSETETEEIPRLIPERNTS